MLLKIVFTPKIFFPLLLLIGSVAAAITLHYLIFLLFRTIWKNNKFLLMFVERLKFPVIILLLILAIESITPTASKNKNMASALEHIMSILIICSISWASIQAVIIARLIFEKKHNINAIDNLKARKVHTQLRVLERIIIGVVVVITICTILMTFENIKRFGVSLLASAGVAGLIIGFAAQRSIATVLAGLQIAFTQPIRIDDVVIIENEWGWIEEITLTYTVVRLWDRRRMIVPTTYWIEKPFQNWTRSTSDLIGTVFIYTDYEVPVDDLRIKLTQLLENNPLWDKEVNVLQVTNLTGNHVEIRILLSCKDSSSLFDLRAYVREEMMKYIQVNYPESLPRTRVELRPASLSSEVT